MKKIIVANWKMNPATPREAKGLYLKTKKTAQSQTAAKVVICPPSIFIGFLNHQASPKFDLGVQNISIAKTTGPFTGSISAAQVRYAGVAYAILGHSESRSTGDTDEQINLKIRLALAAKLAVILCVGESQRDDQGGYLGELSKQLERGLAGVPKSFFQNITIAYEPVWAVGAAARGADTPAEFLHHKLFIQKIISRKIGAGAAKAVPVIYGGSVTVKNARDFLTVGQADGLLVGRESLQSDHFKQIVYAAT